MFVELFGSSRFKEDFHVGLVCLTLHSFRATLAEPIQVHTAKAVCGIRLLHTSSFAGKETLALGCSFDHFDFFCSGGICYLLWLWAIKSKDFSSSSQLR
jgi:hypothetical protein